MIHEMKMKITWRGGSGSRLSHFDSLLMKKKQLDCRNSSPFNMKDSLLILSISTSELSEM